MRLAPKHSGYQVRRGVTLVEMLVVVALLVLMMTILASIFQVATGAISVSRTIQELDNNLKFLDMTIRQDLTNTTAKMTPPNDPSQNRGYFEYAENAPADLQGEDTDDTLAMTVKAPEGQTFTGRIWVPATGSPNATQTPIPVTSQFAEVIYFLRNGNLYRRVLLIVPERKGSFIVPQSTPTGLFSPLLFDGQTVSWQAVNDVSSRPNSDVTNGTNSDKIPVPNTLGTLTNRENRFGRQRFFDDYRDSRNNTTGGGTRDGIIDDANQDGIPDYWPTLTFSQVQAASATAAGGPFIGLMNEDSGNMPGANSTYPRIMSADVYCFPFIFPGAYSVPESSSVANGIGWLHALDDRTFGGVFTGALQGLFINHAPLEYGDSLPALDASQNLQIDPTHGRQTFFGYPTFRETASVNWRDPVESVSSGVFYFGGPGGGSPSNTTPGVQPLGLQTFNQAAIPARSSANFPPPIGSLPPLGTFAAPSYPYGYDGAGGVGSTAFVSSPVPLANATAGQLAHVWEDDLIMTGVRSFDVKAYDPSAAVYNSPNIQGNATGPFYNAGYYDLGYASSDYVKFGNTVLLNGGPPANVGNAPGVAALPSAIQDGNYNPIGFGHEGRMPPLTTDNRVDPQRPLIKNINPNQPYQINNIGDNTGTSLAGLGLAASFAPQRLRRVWDSWSTDYTNAPAVDLNLRGSPIQPFPLDRPIYPSYPPPYPQPLRGIQIQIRVVDPKNERVKVLTIRQDFSDKLQ